MTAGIMDSQSLPYRLFTIALRAALLATLLGAGWLTYRQLPDEAHHNLPSTNSQTELQLVLHLSPDMGHASMDIPIEISPVDIVAVRHEYFSERRPGKPYDDFLTERMNGRMPISTRLDQQGQAIILIDHGAWWVHAVLTGEEDVEWRLPINVSGTRQVIELTSQNAYGRSKTF